MITTYTKLIDNHFLNHRDNAVESEVMAEVVT